MKKYFSQEIFKQTKYLTIKYSLNLIFLEKFSSQLFSLWSLLESDLEASSRRLRRGTFLHPVLLPSIARVGLPRSSEGKKPPKRRATAHGGGLPGLGAVHQAAAQIRTDWFPVISLSLSLSLTFLRHATLFDSFAQFSSRVSASFLSFQSALQS